MATKKIQTEKKVVDKRASSKVTAKSTKSKKTNSKKVVPQKDFFLKEKFMVSAAQILVKAASFAANAALYNKEVGKRLDKRGREALQVVGQLAQGVKEDIREGVKAAQAAKVRKSAQPKKIKVTSRRK